MTERLRVGVLGASGTWHTRGLLGALAARGHDTLAIPATRLRSEIDEHGDQHVLAPEGAVLDALDLLIVRGLPRGSLEQVIFRMDALHVLADRGVRCVNSPRAIERTIDKSWAGAVLAGAGVPTAPTVVCERYEDAMAAFDRLGGDIVVKPLFGAMGTGIVRIEDPDVAHRVFRALELERTVYYVQRTIAPTGRRDLRVLVVGDQVAGAMERVSDSWRANIARGARPLAAELSEPERELAVAAATTLEVEVAGVDLLVAPDGEVVVLEVNGIPGWQALQSVTPRDLTERVVSACLALVDVHAHPRDAPSGRAMAGGAGGGGSGEAESQGRVLLTEATAQWRRDDLPVGDLPGAVPDDPPPSLAKLRAAGLIGDRWEYFFPAENAVARRLQALGIELHSIGRTTRFRTPDSFAVDTEHTVEMKVPKTPTFNAFRRALRQGRAQSPRLVVFIEGVPVSEAQAVTWLQRSLGRYGGGYQEVLVVGDGFGILWP